MGWWPCGWTCCRFGQTCGLDTPGSATVPGIMRIWVLTAVLSAGAAWADNELGAQLPDGARKVGEHRYRAPGDLEATLKYYRAVYPIAQYPRRAIVNQPGVKAYHLPNTGKGNWEGLNIYQANDEVRIYVVPAEGAATAAKKRPAK